MDEKISRRSGLIILKNDHGMTIEVGDSFVDMQNKNKMYPKRHFYYMDLFMVSDLIREGKEINSIENEDERHVKRQEWDKRVVETLLKIGTQKKENHTLNAINIKE